MEVFIPIDMLIRANRIKYRYLVWPGIVIVINFILSITYPSLFTKYVSILALVFYFLILFIFRFKRNYPKYETDVVVSPINGKIVHIKTLDEGYVVSIKKPFFASCEFVTCTRNDFPKVLITEKPQVSWKIESQHKYIFIDETVEYQAVLVGIVPGTALCEVFIPNIYKINAVEGSVLEAGFSELGVKIENYENEAIVDISD